MANKNYKAFIVEGDSREPRIIENIQRVYFNNSNFKILTIPAGQNIYMLWKKMKEDDFDTDIIEVLRESDKALRKLLEEVIPESVFGAQCHFIANREIFILSAFPEFLLDYFRIKFWNSCLIDANKMQNIGCEKNRK